MITNNRKQLKRGIAIFAFVLISFAVYSCKSDPKVDNELEMEKQVVLKELQDMSTAYDVAINNSKEKDSKLEDAKLKIEKLIDSLKIIEPSYKALIKLKGMQLELDSELKNLIRDNKELRQDNNILVYSLTKRKDQLAKSKELNASLNKEKEGLVEEKEDLNKKINEANFLNLLDLTIEGVKEKSSGKEILTDKARRVNKFKICYSIAKNTLIKESNKTLYVQILDPNNAVVVSKDKALKAEGSDNEYSFKTAFVYKNENLNVCDYFTFNEDKDLEEGTYTVNIYDGDLLVTTSKITLE
ncbi:hypothetical protein [Lacinutrix sp. Bg11-31]|uniref:hypothetical protein n=1 Tax=Lacinutrix sp. Bg11-31 TaxID=2057808 RepID=UPI000C3192A7|nr:hypothetical protein [Lacinutrix sp. Bg11-31]AUC82981.1 hypothetical protein CW733_12930 [Lacinutrix sp. Bg11-31]